MHLITFKIVAATTIFLLTVIFGLLPARIAKTRAHWLHLGDAFAGGVFLSAALLHLLPDADNKFREILSGNDIYPFAYLICITAFICLLIMERGISAYNKNREVKNKNLSSFLLVLLLSIHSLAEGAAIGAGNSLIETSMIFFAVIAHKGSESFALAVNLQRHLISAANIKKIILFFALVTPLGIFIASLVTYLLQTGSGNLLGAILDAITAGTFLYLGTEHMLECDQPFEHHNEILALIIGIAMMAVIAIWN